MRRRDLQAFRGMTLAWNCRSQPRSMRAFARAIEAGAKIAAAAEDRFWGGYRGYFADPDGHVWEVAYNPGFPLVRRRPAAAARTETATLSPAIHGSAPRTLD